jgi:hypothetical protein
VITGCLLIVNSIKCSVLFTAVGDDGKSECCRVGYSIYRVGWAKSEGGAIVGDVVKVWLYVIYFKLIWTGFTANVRY